MKPLTESIGFNIKVGWAVMSRRIRRMLSELGFSLPEYWILRALNDRDGMSPFEICRLFQSLPTQITAGVKLLTKKGLVKGVVSSNDKRVNHIFLTEAGRKSLKQLEELRERHISTLGLSSAEQKTICELMRKIISSEQRPTK